MRSKAKDVKETTSSGPGPAATTLAWETAPTSGVPLGEGSGKGRGSGRGERDRLRGEGSDKGRGMGGQVGEGEGEGEKGGPGGDENGSPDAPS